MKETRGCGLASSVMEELVCGWHGCTECHLLPPDKPTMNFGRLHDGTSEFEASAVILHEFGHALGCLHEYQFPAFGILAAREDSPKRAEEGFINGN